MTTIRMPEAAPEVRLLVVDSNRMSSQLLADALKRGHTIEVVCATASFSEAWAAVANERVDVALLSAGLDGDGQKGFFLSRELRKIKPGVKTIMLLESSRRDRILEAFRAGASGVFCRTDSVELLAKCVRMVRNGQIWANSRELGYVVTALAESSPVRAIDTKAAALLSKREQEVVRSVGTGLTNREIAEKLGLSDHTVKNYLFHIFEKLGISSRVELVIHALAHDFRYPDNVTRETASMQSAIVARRYGPKTASPLPTPIARGCLASGTED